MLQYIVRRVTMAFVVVILVMTFLVLLVHFIPGDPVQTILGPRATPELAQTVRHQMELDRPVPVQVVDFIVNSFRGDLGRDFITQLPVSDLIRTALPNTIILAVSSLLVAVLVAIPVAVVAAAKPNSWLDRIAGLMSISMITIPSYVGALLLLLLFSVRFSIFPAVGSGTLSHPGDYLRHLVLPVITLALGWIGYLARLLRASMLEVLGTNYIRTAMALGLSKRLIFYKYALKNAVVPTVAVLGVGLGNLLGGAIFVEVIFSRSGLGTLILNSIETRNYPIVRGAVLVVAILFVAANLLADLSYRLLDPRIRVESPT